MVKKLLSACLLVIACSVANAASENRAYGAYSKGDYETAFSEFSILARQNNPKMQYQLAYMYYNGEGTVQDYNEAFKWYTLSAEQGNSWAQYQLARMYYFGRGTEHNYSKAFRWYKLSAEQGHKWSQYWIGEMYYKGEGTEQNYSKAFNWFKLSADQGYSESQYMLGVLYYSGKGTEHNYSEAFKWFKSASDQGTGEATVYLGIAAAKGEGVKQDYGESRKWYQLAIDQGIEAGTSELAALEEAIKTIETNDITNNQNQPFLPANFKSNLVLLPIEVVSSEESYEDEYGAGIQSGLSNSFRVFYGADVEKELEKEYSKLDCTAESCNQALAIAFNGELIADASVSKVPGGYLLKLIITNVLTNEVVWSKARPCKGCDLFSLLPALEQLGAAAVIE